MLGTSGMEDFLGFGRGRFCGPPCRALICTLLLPLPPSSRSGAFRDHLGACVLASSSSPSLLLWHGRFSASWTWATPSSSSNSSSYSSFSSSPLRHGRFSRFWTWKILWTTLPCAHLRTPPSSPPLLCVWSFSRPSWCLRASLLLFVLPPPAWKIFGIWNMGNSLEIISSLVR